MKKILLGSGSPRRRELLTMMGMAFEQVKLHDVEETYPSSLAADEVPVYLSRLKAESYRDNIDGNSLLITADTVVICDGCILGKPVCEEDAAAMLRRLSGRSHRVVTGVTVSNRNMVESFSETTYVEFAQLTDDEIGYYIDKYRPYDKAGAYGIQEWIGLIGITKIDGCFYNVMGLPTAALYRCLKRLDAINC